MLDDALGRRVDGGPLEQVDELLRDFNQVVVEDGVGGLEKVLLSSAERPAAAVPRGNEVDMTRRGRHHMVTVLLTGPIGVTRTESLMSEMKV